MEGVIRAVAPLRAVADVPQAQFDIKSPVVAARLEALLKSLDALPPQERLLPLEVANYVNAPVFSLLQKEALSDLQTEYVLRILGFLFQYPWASTTTLATAQQFISVCVYVIAPTEPGKNPEEAFKNSSVEVRTAGFNCLTSIINAAVIQRFAAQLESPLTQAVLVFALNGIKLGQRSEDQLAAVEFLGVLLREVVSDVGSILPNTASVLNNFVSNKYGFKHSAPRISATIVLGYVLKESFGSAKSREWVQNAAVQVEKILQNLCKEAQKAAGQLRAAIVDLALDLATNCWEQLALCHSAILDIVLMNSAAFERAYRTRSLAKSIDSKMLEYLDRLPQTLTSHDSALSSLNLSTLQAYVGLEPPKIFIESLTEKIQDAMPLLTQSSKHFYNDSPDTQTVVKLLGSGDNHSELMLLDNLKVETGVQPVTQEALAHLLRQVGATAHAEPVLETLLEQVMDSNGLAQLQPLWMATMMLGTKYLPATEGYLRHAFDVVSSLTVGTEAHTPPSVLALNVYLMGELALVPELNFQELLVDGLFPVVDLLGSDSSLVIEQAKLALQKIAAGCDYNGVMELILDNKDYVLDGISNNLNTLNIRPATLTMLTVLIKITGKDIVMYLEDVLTALFIILDKFHGYSRLVDGIFSVFYAVVESVDAVPLKIEPAKDGLERKITNMAELFEELARRPELDADLVDSANAAELPQEEPLEEINSDDESEQDDFEPPPENKEEWNSCYDKPTYMIVKNIFDRCNIFLTHKSPNLQAKILQVVARSIPILATSTDLWLPKVHEIWPVVRARVNEGHIFIQEAAFDVAAALCVASQEFMSQRVEELWKDMCKSRPLSFFKRPWPPRSHESRFIHSLCTALSTILQHTRLDFETVDSILWTLQPCWTESLKASLERVNADNVWLCLKSIENVN